jgi:ABC-type uncharacterized transport system substrate-binding protein
MGIVLACTWLLCGSQSRADEQQVRIAVLVGPQRSYGEAASALQSTLADKGFECTLLKHPKGGDSLERQQVLRRLATLNPTVIAAAGPEAVAEASQVVANVPVIFFMVPNVLDAPFLAEGAPRSRRLAGVTTDVQPEELMDWITRLHAQGKSLGILYSSRSQRTAKALASAAGRRSLKVSLIEAHKDRFPAAIEALNQAGCDSVLMIPDARIYNSPNVQRLLLWGARHKKPIWTFSQNIVKAGALAGMYCDSRSIGRQAAEIIVQVLEGTDVSAIGLQYPKEVGKAVNKHTAEVTGLSLGEELQIAGISVYGD